MDKSLKSLILIPLIVVSCLGGAAVVLAGCGIRIRPLEPTTAALACSLAAVLGMVPILRTGRKDPVSTLQLALMGTVIHMVTAAVMSVLLILTRAVDARGGFAFWALAGYWVSLLALIWQLRRHLMVTFEMQNRAESQGSFGSGPPVGTAKVQK